MTKVFDGKVYQKELLDSLQKRLLSSKEEPKLVSILVGNDRASEIYTNLKKKACEYVGAHMEIVHFPGETSKDEIKSKIQNLNEDITVKGIMIQLPLPEILKSETKNIIETIMREKDIDGMRDDSEFTPATVRAVNQILKLARNEGFLNSNSKIAVVGSKGSVGSKIKFDEGFDKGDDLFQLKDFDVVISATGVANLITPEMIKEDAVLIDVGAPLPEFEEGCYEKASFYTPVPGGVGPVTIVSLVENLLD